MFKFERNDQTAAGNLLNQGVSFDEAVSVFGDALALTFADTNHTGVEGRSRTYGISNKARLLVVIHTGAPQRHSNHQRTKGNLI